MNILKKMQTSKYPLKTLKRVDLFEIPFNMEIIWNACRRLLKVLKNQWLCKRILQKFKMSLEEYSDRTT